MKKNQKLNFNWPVPDMDLLNIQGEPVRLESLWKERPLLLAFTRHFGCTQCKEMLEELVAGKERIKEAGLDIAIIMQGDPASTALFAEKYAPGLFCLADP